MKTIYIIGAAFAGDSTAAEHIASVDRSGTVRVYDAAVSGHYTTCHSLTEEQQQAIREARDHSTVII